MAQESIAIDEVILQQRGDRWVAYGRIPGGRKVTSDLMDSSELATADLQRAARAVMRTPDPSRRDDFIRDGGARDAIGRGEI